VTIYLNTHCRQEDSNLQRDLTFFASRINDDEYQSGEERLKLTEKSSSFCLKFNSHRQAKDWDWKMRCSSVRIPAARSCAEKDTTNDRGTEG
jgi:hypothetical protein